MSSARNYESLGRKVKQQLGDGPGPERREHIKKAFSEMTVASRHRPPRRRNLAMAAAFVLLTGGATFVLMEVMVPRPVVFWVGSETIQGEEGAWLQASAEEPLPVRFEDGTRIELRQNSTGRVVTANRKKVSVELGRGKLRANINRHKTRSTWTVEAGPYRVTALGTEFSVVWKAEPFSLDVRVFRGRVSVRGPGLRPKGRELGAGEHLSLRKEGTKTVTRFGKGAPGDPDVTEGGPAALENKERDEAIRVAKLSLPSNVMHPPPEPARDQAPAPRDAKVAGLDGHQPESWQEFYDLHRYAEAIEVAGKSGLEELYATLDGRELWQLADAARYAGKGVEAKRALLSLRRRFRDSWRAVIAAFLLGRVAFEIQGDARAACNWFHIYLREDPGGRLAEEALGRSIGACDEAGMRSRAMQAAKDYLEKYPQGTFIEAAELMSSMGGDAPR